MTTNVYWVYADSTDDDVYVSGADEYAARCVAAVGLRRKPDALTARYVITTGDPDRTIERLYRERQARQQKEAA